MPLNLNVKKIASTLFISLAFISNIFCDSNSNKLVKDLTKAENFYLTRSTNILDKNKSDLKEQLQVLKKLYKHQEELHKSLKKKQQQSKSPQEFNKELDPEFKQFQLTKEIIRHFEKHLKENHNWKEINHFSNIVKPLTVTTTLATLTMLSLKLAKISGITTDQTLSDYKVNNTTITGTYATIASIWILINYLKNLSTK